MNEQTQLKPGGPDAVTLTICHSCQRTDRWSKLTARHHSRGGGRWCPGPIEEVLYFRAFRPESGDD